MSADPDPSDIIRIDEVMDITGLRKTMLYDLILREQFPRQVSLGARAVGWYKREVIEWNRNRPMVKGKRESSPKLVGNKKDGLLESRETAPRSECEAAHREPFDNSARISNLMVDRVLELAVTHRNLNADKRSSAAVLSSMASKRKLNAAKAGFSSAARNETAEIERLRNENSRLKGLLADLVLQNDTLQSEIRNSSSHS
jgi:prophage regulatory protein